MTFDRMPRTEIARAFDVHPLTVSRWKKAGMPCNKDGTYNLPACINWVVERAKARDEAASDAADETSKWLAEYRKERAMLARLERQAKEGALIHRDEALRWVAQLVTEAKAALLSVPRRLAPVLCGMEPRDIEESIRQELHAALRKLARPASTGKTRRHARSR